MDFKGQIKEKGMFILTPLLVGVVGDAELINVIKERYGKDMSIYE